MNENKYKRNSKKLMDIIYEHRASYLLYENKFQKTPEHCACDECLAFIEEKMNKFNIDQKEFFDNWKKEFIRDVKLHAAPTKTGKAKVLLDGENS